MLKAVLLVVLVQQCSAIIYKLNETQHNMMPPLFGLDDYARCLAEPAGTYCLLDVHLHGDNALMNMIRGYSEHRLKHFNYTQIHRGVCVTKTCKNFIQNRSIERTEDLKHILEECLNRSLWEDYQLNGKVANIEYCNRANEEKEVDTSVVAVLIVYLLIILLNVVGSSYDRLFCQDNEKSGNKYLLTFSIFRNWKRLMATTVERPDPRLSRLKVFNGLRVLTMFCVIFSHIPLIMVHAYIDNPLYIEKGYDDVSKQLAYNGSLVTHTFFVMSAFLLAFNFQIQMEKRPVSWTLYPKGILQRWIRLTPLYALVIATVSTVVPHLGRGPLWDRVVTSEATACRQYWWAHILYINNYVYNDAYCLPQTWYLAADTQLFCVGLLVCMVARSVRARKVVLSLMFAASIVIPALQTYFQNLDAVVLQSPETCRSLYQHDATFRLLYGRAHTNLSTYTLGLTGGFLAYYWFQSGKDFSKYKGLRWLHWAMFPVGVAVILTGALFYVDGSPPSDLLRVAYAALYRPVFQMLVIILIIGFIFKVESVYRGILEWDGFTWMGRVSYNAFLLHSIFQRSLIGSMPTPIHIADYFVVIIVCASIFLCYMFGAILFIMLESPIGQLTKYIFEGSAPRKPDIAKDDASKLSNGNKAENISYISRIESSSKV